MKNSFGKIINALVIYVYVFHLLYFPNFSSIIGVDGITVYLIMTILLILGSFPRIKKIKINFKNPLVIFVVLNVLFTFYFAIRNAIASADEISIDRLRIVQNLFPLFQLIGCVVLSHKIEGNGFNKEEKIDLIFKVALIQSFFAVLSMLVPFVKELALSMFYNGRDEVNQYISKGRIFGFCGGDFTYGLQTQTALIALLAFFKGVKQKRKKYIAMSLIIQITSILNGRTGTIIFLFGVMVILLRELLLKARIRQLCIIVAAISLVIPVSYSIITIISPSTSKIINHGINDIKAYMAGNTSDTETDALVSGLKLPEKNIDIVFGSGYRIYGRGGQRYGNNEKSDIGFVNDIYMAGIFSIVLLYLSYVQLFAEANSQNKEWKGVFALLMVFTILANIKGEVFRSQLIISALLLACILLLTDNNYAGKLKNVQEGEKEKLEC